MKFLLACLALAMASTHALPQYNYDSPIPKQGYVYPPPEVSFVEPLPPITTTSSPANNNPQKYQASYIPPKKPNSPPPESTGYIYPVPPKPFPSAPSNTLPTMRTPTTYPTTAGYVYTHPSVPFTISSNTSNRDPSVPLTPPLAISTPDFSKSKSYSNPQSNLSTAMPFTTPIVTGYNYPRPTIPFKTPSKPPTSGTTSTHPTSPRKSSGYSYPPPIVSFSLPTKSSSIHLKPEVELPPPKSSQPLKFTAAPTSPSPTKSTPPAQNINGYTYKSPDYNFIVPPKRLSTNSQPLKKIGYFYTPPVIPFNPATSPKIVSAVTLSPTDPTEKSGYFYSKPRVPLDLPSPVLETSPPRSKFGYTYAPPTIPFAAPERISKATTLPRIEPAVTLSPTDVTETTKITGYLYPKPEVSLNFASRTLETEQPPSKFGYTYTQISETNPPRTKVGYTYSTPAIYFTTPERTSKVTTLPTFEPAVAQSTTGATKTTKLTGYFYPKPQVSLDLPQRTPKPTTLPTKMPEIKQSPKGYFYLKPKMPFDLPPLPKPGYTYTAPVKPFRTPEKTSKATTLPKTVPAVTQSPTNPTKTIKTIDYSYRTPEVALTFPSGTLKTNAPLSKVGYTYESPAILFTTPQGTPKPRTLLSIQLPRDKAKPTKTDGYIYPTPEVPFDLPSASIRN